MWGFWDVQPVPFLRHLQSCSFPPRALLSPDILAKGHNSVITLVLGLNPGTFWLGNQCHKKSHKARETRDSESRGQEGPEAILRYLRLMVLGNLGRSYTIMKESLITL